MTVLKTDVSLCGGFLTWLTRTRREWLNGRKVPTLGSSVLTQLRGRYLNVKWDVKELEQKKDEIVAGDKLKLRMVV
jgi:hypothetical protein